MTIKEITVNGATYELEAKYENITGAPTNLSDFNNDEGYAKSENLSPVATSGEYNDLSGKPNLSTVATSGAYSDLSGKPDLSGFLTANADNLVNYYLKSETYTRQEVLNLIGQLQKLTKQVVNVLPVTGEDNVMYLVPKTTAGTSNVFDEYLYINNAWEKVGDTEIDLTNYVQKTDYATMENAGVVKVNTLGNYGVSINGTNHQLNIVSSSDTEIAQKNNNYKPLTPAHLDYAVKTSLATNTLTLTSAEKSAIQSWLGVDDAIDDAIDTSITQVLGGSY